MRSLPLGNMPLDTFLAEYWQKKPLLIRNGLVNPIPPLSAEELAGLACEQDIESRLIINDQDNDSWELIHGPLNDGAFASLPSSHWTLLVQAVDHWVPQAAQLLEQFNFIPRWRIDDLMMSYASDGGGVGPHFDYYDVFLLQTNGSRRWEVGGNYNDQAAFKENLPVKILKDFTPTESWLLEPGDILYVPPGVGHNGIAQGDGCMTCSVGYRAPSHCDILREYTDYIGEQLPESLRYQDPDLNYQANTGEISQQSINQLHEILNQYIEDKDAIRHWFGRYITAPKYSGDQQIEQKFSQDQLIQHLESGGVIQRNESSRFAYQIIDNEHHLYVDGEFIETENNDNGLIEILCSDITYTQSTFETTAPNLDLLLRLLQCAALYKIGRAHV